MKPWQYICIHSVNNDRSSILFPPLLPIFAVLPVQSKMSLTEIRIVCPLSLDEFRLGHLYTRRKLREVENPNSQTTILAKYVNELHDSLLSDLSHIASTVLHTKRIAHLVREYIRTTNMHSPTTFLLGQRQSPVQILSKLTGAFGTSSRTLKALIRYVSTAPIESFAFTRPFFVLLTFSPAYLPSCRRWRAPRCTWTPST
jgi:hypothetical protein